MQKDILKIYSSKKTVFSMNDLAILLSETNEKNLKAQIYYYVKRGYLIRLRRGFFARSDDYDRRELATMINTPSYVSFETVLLQEGVIFQYYTSIFVASYLSREFKVGDQNIIFRKLKPSILYNPAGIVNKGNYYEATRERAFLDTVYLQGDIGFDSLREIDWKKCMELAKIYENKSFEKIIKRYRRDYA